MYPHSSPRCTETRNEEKSFLKSIKGGRRGPSQTQWLASPEKPLEDWLPGWDNTSWYIQFTEKIRKIPIGSSTVSSIVTRDKDRKWSRQSPQIHHPSRQPHTTGLCPSYHKTTQVVFRSQLFLSRVSRVLNTKFSHPPRTHLHRKGLAQAHLDAIQLGMTADRPGVLRCAAP